ncbi:MAG: hypothetical protein EPN82_09710 [Bacteroidetes bacterium]|nr:MAG: hypothetical protein EPN82_09710 [Bacteroidota bacterium]
MKKLIILIAIILLFTACSDNSCDSNESDYSNFKISDKSYPETLDLDSVVITNYGSQYRMADWIDLLKIISIEDFANDVGIKKGSHYYVKNNGERFLDGSNRHFFISRFDHNKPDSYLAHDQIDSNFLCLGSWYGDTLQILLVKK